jgi:thioredoxin reductase (NADPH)
MENAEVSEAQTESTIRPVGPGRPEKKNRVETADRPAAATHDAADRLDVLIVGAGPAGLHAASTAQDLGLSHLIVDRRGVAHSFVEYPQTLRFFSPADEMEVGGVPFPTRGGDKPTREDILPYFRSVVRTRKLCLAVWQRIASIERDDAGFLVRTLSEPDGDAEYAYRSRTIVLASGVWDVPARLSCPGAGLPHVLSRFDEPTEYCGMDVLVAGGGNSAVHAALTLAEARARVTLAMRRSPAPYQSHLRPFVVRDLEMAVDEGRLRLVTGAIAARVEPQTAWLQPADYDPLHPAGGVPCGDPYPVPARFVFALLGQRADPTLFEQLGLALDIDGRPQRDEQTFETGVPRVYVAGSLAGKSIDVIVSARDQVAGVIRRIAERIGHN